MSEARDVETAWRWLLERRPHTRGAHEDALVPIAEAAYRHPMLARLYPFPTRGTLRFLRTPSPWHDADDLPIVGYAGPPYTVYAGSYASIVGTASNADEAVTLIVAHLPDDVVS
ncbi:DUF6193 family natural product biosynthesis protein [Hamadaea sp. NPDC050747]|uniref:DUF6193 family natural product biosynthesis protein n=1 Tax=Hamadaea sp. NPDC050747 TaxID=3155789 RepID=UPI0033FC0BB9